MTKGEAEEIVVILRRMRLKAEIVFVSNSTTNEAYEISVSGWMSEYE